MKKENKIFQPVMISCRGYGKGLNDEIFCRSFKKYFYFFLPQFVHA